MFIVYILFSPSFNRYYIGFTGDTMTERLAKHLSTKKNAPKVKF
jgi:predicted GIY-YIG superfamily endonuclease